MSSKFETILILDFGSQYTQLIGRRIREANVYSEIVPFNTPLEKSEGTTAERDHSVRRAGSVYEARCSGLRSRHFRAGCSHSRRLLRHAADRERNSAARVEPSTQREYGSREIDPVGPSCLLDGMRRVWMSHGDRILEPPPGFAVTARSNTARWRQWKIPSAKSSVSSSIPKSRIPTTAARCCADSFSISAAAQATGQSDPSSTLRSNAFANRSAMAARICAISGGVDSTVAATLVHRAIGDRLTGVFVNNGLLRKNEFEKVLSMLQNNLHLNVRGVDASDRFLNMLAGVTDPEKKRKIIGDEFIRVFEEEARRIGAVDFLVQGTLYPDVIESVSVKGPSQTIKSHHNVGGLPERMRVEAGRALARTVQRRSAARRAWSWACRKTWSGASHSRARVWRFALWAKLRAKAFGCCRKRTTSWFPRSRRPDCTAKSGNRSGVLLPVKSVGVMGDNRTYDHTLAIRAVHSTRWNDGGLGAAALRSLNAVISNRIVNEVKGINRVVYDITSKPPATIEWE